MRDIGQNINKAKKRIELLCGTKLLIKVNEGRGKTSCFTGIIEDMYPSLFTFRTDSGELKTFYYSDVLTKSVKFFKNGER